MLNETPLLGSDAIGVLLDGTLSEPAGLDHPECVAVDAEGGIWCGGERGQVYRLAPDGSSLEEVACSGGFTLGIAFAPNGDLFLCDLKTALVLRMPAGSDRLETFAEGAGGARFRVPNSLAFDADGCLYVSDSHGFKDPGPGIFRFEPGGEGDKLRRAEVFDFANGVALAPDGRSLYMAETFANRIVRVAVGDDGDAGAVDVIADLPGVLRTASPSTPPATSTSAATSRVRSSASRPTARCERSSPTPRRTRSVIRRTWPFAGERSSRPTSAAGT